MGHIAMEQLAVAGGDLTGVRAGSGRDLVMLHSLLTDRHAFDRVLPPLAARFRVTVPNLPGFHGAAPVRGGLEAYAEWVEGAFGRFEIEREPNLQRTRLGGSV